MLDTGKDADWFSSTPIVVEALITAVAFAAFLIWELTGKNPIVDLSLFKSRNFSLGGCWPSPWAMRCSSPTTC